MFWFINPMNIVTVLLIIGVVIAIWKPDVAKGLLDKVNFDVVFDKGFEFAMGRLKTLYGLSQDLINKIAQATERVLMKKIQNIISDKAKEIQEDNQSPSILEVPETRDYRFLK